MLLHTLRGRVNGSTTNRFAVRIYIYRARSRPTAGIFCRATVDFAPSRFFSKKIVKNKNFDTFRSFVQLFPPKR